MGAPKYARFVVDFDEWFPQGLYMVGEVQAVTEYLSQEDKARHRPVRPRVDEVTGRLLFRGTFADPSAEKDREKSVTVEFACAHQPVPPAAVAGLPFRPVVLEGMTMQPRGGVGAGQVDHLDHPGHRHDGAPWCVGRCDCRGQAGVRQVCGRHDWEGCGVTSPELSCDVRGRSAVGRWDTAPMTAGFGVRVAHEVTDEAFAAGRGEYEAVCGVVFVAAPLVAPPGRPCPACLSVLAVARRAAGAPRRPHRYRRRGGLLLRRLVAVGPRHRARTGQDVTR